MELVIELNDELEIEEININEEDNTHVEEEKEENAPQELDEARIQRLIEFIKCIRNTENHRFYKPSPISDKWRRTYDYKYIISWDGQEYVYPAEAWSNATVIPYKWKYKM